MQSTKADFLVGTLGAAHGIKGWVRVNSFTDPQENIFGYTPWHLRAAGDGSQKGTVIPLEHKAQGKGLIVRLEGIDDRNAAELLRGLEIRVDREHLPPPAEGEFYWADLEGLRVIDQTGTELGHVDHLLDTGSADVMVIVGARRLLIPFIYGQTVIDVDVAAGLLRVDWDSDE